MHAAIATTLWTLFAFANIRAGQEAATWEEANRRGTDLQFRGRYTDAATAFQEALRLAEHFDSDDPRVSGALNNLASVYQDLGRYLEAEKLYRRTIMLIERTHGPDSVQSARAQLNLLSMYTENGQCGPSVRLARRIARIEDTNIDRRETAIRLHATATVLHTCKRYTEAEALYGQALSLLDSESSGRPSSNTDILNNLATLYASTGNPAAAIKNLLQALALLEAAVGKNHPGLIKSLSNLAVVYSTTGRQSDAEELLRRALDITKATFGPDHRSYGNLLSNYAVVLRRLKRKNEAIEAERQAKNILKTTDGTHSSAATVDVSEIVRGK